MSSIPQHYRRGDATNRNRRRKLQDRLKRLIDNSSLPGHEKVFLRQNIKALMQEYAELWEHRLPKTEENGYARIFWKFPLCCPI